MTNGLQPMTPVKKTCSGCEAEQPPERFWSKVDKTDSCWLWTGATAGAGYGQLWVGGRRVYVHRFAYEQFVGPIPEGFQIDHLCRIHNCVNPAHLEAVTQRENVLRGVAPPAVNAQKTHCPQGHAYDAKNVRGDRICRPCHRAQNRAWAITAVLAAR